MGIENELQAAVRADGRPQAVIARAAGMHPVSLNRFMQGSRGLSVEAAEKLALALKVRVCIGPKPRRKP